MPKPMLCVDFDGVIHHYVTPNQPWDPTRVHDGPTEGAIRFLRMASEEMRVAVYSSRSHQPGGIEAMQEWLRRHLRAGDSGWYAGLLFPREKPPAHVSLDDRALTFDGTWPSIRTLLEFKPWNRK